MATDRPTGPGPVELPTTQPAGAVPDPAAEAAIDPDLDHAVDPELAPDLEPVEPTPPRPVRRRGVGPFSLRQVAIAMLVVMGTAIGLTLATVPISPITPGLPRPEASAYLLGSPIPGLRLGDLAPELVVDRPEGRLELTDLDGNPIRLADLRGKAVWINFWASWCPPCQYETPTLRALDQRYRDRGLVIVGIQVQQTVQAGIDYATRYELEYRIGADVTGSFFHLYRGFALPTQFFIDENGVIRQIVNGPLSEANATTLIEAILPDVAGSPGPSSAPASSAPSPAPSPAPSITFPPNFPTSPHPANTAG